ncbi:unnamed protein product [Brugia timori]|uniref:Uncharacterized protein n=1 Tax=Brugia timori TaxID=42155 RepID=A0A0R3QTM1_9BILA|nr:unnamed protein product [Brugia timori]
MKVFNTHINPLSSFISLKTSTPFRFSLKIDCIFKQNNRTGRKEWCVTRYFNLMESLH